MYKINKSTMLFGLMIVLMFVPTVPANGQPPNEEQPPQLVIEPTLDETTPGEFEEASDDHELRSSTRGAPFTRARLQSEFGPDEKEWISDNCALGIPKADPGAGLGVIRIIAREGYVAGHSPRDKIPCWVCEHSTVDELSGPGNRKKSKFATDPLLQPGERAELSDYKGSDTDRGHMHPAANAKKSQQMMDETHFLSNMLPQIGPTFNRGIWAKLEDTVRVWTRDRGDTWIISGPLFYDPLEEDDATADGIIPYTTIGENEVAMPTHCYKIVVAEDENENRQAIAFVFENRRYGRPYRLPLHITTIDWLEERTGLNFFPDLDDDPAQETAIEGKKSAMW